MSRRLIRPNGAVTEAEALALSEAIERDEIDLGEPIPRDQWPEWLRAAFHGATSSRRRTTIVRRRGPNEAGMVAVDRDLARRLGDSDVPVAARLEGEVLAELRDAFADRVRANRRVVDAVQRARAGGSSWQAIRTVAAFADERSE